MSKREFVEIVGPDGKPSTYQRLAPRLKEFLKEYPPKEGFRVVRSFYDRLSTQKGLLSLYETAIKNGRNPVDVGLPPIDTAMVCEVQVLDRNDRVVTNAHAEMLLLEDRDLEVLESRGVQRGIASLGFGGEVFDQDEDKDFARQGLKVSSQATSATPTEPAKPQTVTSEAPKVPDKAPAAVTPASPPSRMKTVTNPATEPAATKPVVDGIPPSIRKQIERAASKKGVEVPSYSNLEEANTVLHDLLRKGGTNGATPNSAVTAA